MSMSRLNLKTSRVFKSSDIQACFTDALNKLKNADDAFSINAVMETVLTFLQDEMERMFSEAMKEWKQAPQQPPAAHEYLWSIDSCSSAASSASCASPSCAS